MHPNDVGGQYGAHIEVVEIEVVEAQRKYTIERTQRLATDRSLPGRTHVVQRWASEGMPLRRQGRFVSTTAQELNEWMGRESGKPVHVATGDTDLTSELKRAVSFARREN
jgi:hypothetical protein